MFSRVLILYLIISISVLLSGCGLLNMLPNENRDNFYWEHLSDMTADTEKFQSVKVGMDKSDVLSLWGEPLRKRNENHWIYKFQYLSEKIHISFKDEAVDKKWTSIWQK